MSLTAYLTVKGAADAITFYGKSFSAKENSRLVGPDGRIGHADLSMGTSHFVLSEEYPDFGALSPVTVGGCPMKMHLSVPDADATVEAAVASGATLVRPVKLEFYGEKADMVINPFGFGWFVPEHVETVAPEEMQRLWDAAMQA